MINSKIKGKVGELEAAKVMTKLTELEFRRGQQFKGTPDSPDILCDGIKDFHFEVKRVQKLNIDKALEQADKDAGEEARPILMHRANDKQWKLTIYAQDLRFFVEKWHSIFNK